MNILKTLNSNISFGQGNINFEEIDNLKIKNYRCLSPNTISGETFSYRQLSDLKRLHNAGIDNIIDFRAEAQSDFGKICQNEGLKYLAFPLDTLWCRDKSSYFSTRKDGKKIATKNLVDKLAAFIAIIKNGNTYMGCHYGIDRTNIGVILNFLFSNFDNIWTPQILSWPEQSKKSVMNKDFKIIKRIIKSLTKEQKQNLNIPNNFYEQALIKFKLILLRNKMI